MRRESHVRFCEGAGVKLPRATRPLMVAANERDARRVMDELPSRLGQYGLTLHPTKTRLLYFRPPARGQQPPPPGFRGFDFLGFTHYWGRTRRGTSWVVKRKTAASRFSRALKATVRWLRAVRHEPVAWQHKQLVWKLRGHYNYYGITGNSEGIARFRHEVVRAWRKWLDRRSTNAGMTWARFERVVLERFALPVPMVRHRIWGGRAANPCH